MSQQSDLAHTTVKGCSSRSYVKKCQPTGSTRQGEPTCCIRRVADPAETNVGARPKGLVPGRSGHCCSRPRRRTHSKCPGRATPMTLNQSQIDRFDAIQLHLSGLSEALMRFAARCADSRCVPIDKIAHLFCSTCWRIFVSKKFSASSSHNLIACCKRAILK